MKYDVFTQDLLCAFLSQTRSLLIYHHDEVLLKELYIKSNITSLNNIVVIESRDLVYK